MTVDIIYEKEGKLFNRSYHCSKCNQDLQILIINGIVGMICSCGKTAKILKRNV